MEFSFLNSILASAGMNFRVDYLFLNNLSSFEPLAYFLIFLGMIIEGDAFIFAVGFLAYQKILDPYGAFLTLFSGAFIGDLVWHKFGMFLAGSRIDCLAKKVSKPFDNLLEKNFFRAVFISKFFYGMHHPLIMKIGALGISLKKFARADFWATLFWVAIIWSAGYFSGASFMHFKRFFHFAEIGLAVGLIVFLIFSRLLAKYSRGKI